MDLSNENVLHIKKDGVEYLQFKKLLEYKDIINHAYSLGIDRNYRTARANKQKLQEDSYQKAMQDYQSLCYAINSKLEHLVKTNQEHTDEVKIAREKVHQDKPYPPKIHNLNILAEKCELQLDDKQTKILFTCNSFNISARYEDYKNEFYKKCTEEYTKQQISNIEEVREWLRKQLI